MSSWDHVPYRRPLNLTTFLLPVRTTRARATRGVTYHPFVAIRPPPVLAQQANDRIQRRAHRRRLVHVPLQIIFRRRGDGYPGHEAPCFALHFDITYSPFISLVKFEFRYLDRATTAEFREGVPPLKLEESCEGDISTKTRVLISMKGKSPDTI